MKRSRFTESKIVNILNEQNAGFGVDDICRRHGIANSTFHKWKAKYGGLSVILPFLMGWISRIKQSSMAACRRWLDEAFHGYRTIANEWHSLQYHSNY